jgi:hypothetical protein
VTVEVCKTLYSGGLVKSGAEKEGRRCTVIEEELVSATQGPFIISGSEQNEYRILKFLEIWN